MRSPVDVLRLLVGAVVAACGVGIANLFDSTLLGLSDDTVSAANGLPEWGRDLPAIALGATVLAAVVAALVWCLLARRYRRFAQLALGFVVAAAISIALGDVIYAAIDDSVQAAFEVDGPAFRFHTDGRPHPGDPLLAGATAMFVVATSYLSRLTVSRLGALLVAYAVFSVLASGLPAVGFITDLGVGLAIGSAALLVFGRHDLTPDLNQIRRALESVGVRVDTIEPTHDPTGASGSWTALTTAKQPLRIQTLGRDDISSDLMVRAYRWVRLRKTGDHRPFVSLNRAADHQALVSLTAAAAGVRTPAVLAVADVGVDNKVLAFADHEERAHSDEDGLTDEELESLWRVVTRLHERKIAHHDLRLANVGWDRGNQPWLLNLGFAETAASEQALGTDLAELLASTSAAVGPDRALSAAHSVGGPQVLMLALPWLQPLALSAGTRAAVGEEGLSALRQTMVDQFGLPAEEPVALERVSGKNLFVLATIGLSAWFLIPQLADIDNIWREARSASPPWVLLAVVFSIATYVAATSSLLGAIPFRLRFWPALLAQIASSFANRITPAKLGGVATNIRYFQCHGVPTTVSVTAVGLNAIAGVAVHVLLTLWFLLLASGTENSGGLALPSTRIVVLVLLIVAAVIGASVALPVTRRQLAAYVVPQLRSGWEAIRVISHSPSRLVLLFGGAAMITLSYLAAMTASLRAFDSTISFPLIGLLFLTGSAVANAAPTPGGLGAAEAALIAAFSTVEDAAIVIPAVFLYRLVTFWLPILPGWAALTFLRHTDNL
ncbi:MAG: flippase-like domain-containing protein [Acidimicrobiales bacterium]